MLEFLEVQKAEIYKSFIEKMRAFGKFPNWHDLFNW
jgi:hypothetical protein